MREKSRQLLLKLQMAVGIAQTPAVTIKLGSDAPAREFYDFVTRRHSRYLVVRNKTFGVALLPISQEKPLFTGKEFQAMRTNRTRARKAGLVVRQFEPSVQIDAMIEIHASASHRQGRTINAHYLDRADVAAFAKTPGLWFGVFDPSNRLAAYCNVLKPGEMFVLNRLMGHGDDLKTGVMYLLIAELTETLRATYTSPFGRPLWMMYDTYIGGNSGLRGFKHLMGFRPYRVRYAWSDKPVLSLREH